MTSESAEERLRLSPLRPDKVTADAKGRQPGLTEKRSCELSPQNDTRSVSRLFSVSFLLTGIVLLQGILFFFAGFYAHQLYNVDDDSSRERNIQQRYRLEHDVWSNLFADSFPHSRLSSVERALEEYQASEFKSEPSRHFSIGLMEEGLEESQDAKSRANIKMRKAFFERMQKTAATRWGVLPFEEKDGMMPLDSGFDERRLSETEAESPEAKPPDNKALSKRKRLQEGRLHLKIPKPPLMVSSSGPELEESAGKLSEETEGGREKGASSAASEEEVKETKQPRSVEKVQKKKVETIVPPSPDEERKSLRTLKRRSRTSTRAKSTSFESTLPRYSRAGDFESAEGPPIKPLMPLSPSQFGGSLRFHSRRFALSSGDRSTLNGDTPLSPHVGFNTSSLFGSGESVSTESKHKSGEEKKAFDMKQVVLPEEPVPKETTSSIPSSDADVNLERAKEHPPKERSDESTEEPSSTGRDSRSPPSVLDLRRRSPALPLDEETGDVYDDDEEPGSDDNIESILRQLSHAGAENADSILEDEDFDARVAQGNQRLFKASQFKPSLRRDLPRFGPSHLTAKQRMRTALRQRLLTNGATRLQAEKERLLRGADGRSGQFSPLPEEGDSASGDKRREGEWAAVPVGLSALVMNEIRNKLEKMFLRIRKHESFRRRLSIPPQPRGMYNHYVKDFVCDKFRSSELHQFWLTLLVVYAFEWPAYAFTAKGGKEFLVELVKTVRSEQQSKIWTEMKACGMQNAFVEGIGKLDMVESGGDLEQILSLAYERHREFQRAVRAFGSLHIPKNETSSIVHVFSLVLDTCIIVWGEELFSGREETQVDFKPYTWNEMYLNFVVKQMEARTYYYDALLLRRVLKQHVTSRPYNGILVLLVKNFVEDESAGVSSGPLDMLEAQVRQSVKMKLERSTRRFWNDSFSGEEVNVKSLDIPEVRVAGYYAKAPGGQVIEKGLLGLEMAPSVVDALKAKLSPRNVLIQVSLLDAWADMPEELWPDAFEDAGAVVTAHAAMQMLKMEFMWDPRLPILEETPTGHTVQLLSSSLVPVFGLEPMDNRRRQFDPDIQVIMMQHEDNYKLIAASGGICNYVLQLVLRKAYGHQGIVRHLDPERIQYQGSAWWLGGQPGMGNKIFRKGIFGRGMNHKKILKIESSLRHDCIMVHIKICGLGEASATADLQELTAIEVLNRLVQRARGNFEFHVDFGNYPTAMAVPLRAPEKKCEGVVPTWMLAVAVGSAFLFFAIVLGLLMYHGRVDIPWWLACWCSRFSPWERGALAALENSARRRSSEEGDPGMSRDEDRKEERKTGKGGGGEMGLGVCRNTSTTEATATVATSSGENSWGRRRGLEDMASSSSTVSKKNQLLTRPSLNANIVSRSDSAWATQSQVSLKDRPVNSSSELRCEEEASHFSLRETKYVQEERLAAHRPKIARSYPAASSLSDEVFVAETLRRSNSERESGDSQRQGSLPSQMNFKLKSVPAPRHRSPSQQQPSEEEWPDEGSFGHFKDRSTFPMRRIRSQGHELSDGDSAESTISIATEQKRKARAALASLSRQQSKRNHYSERLKHASSVRDPIMLAPFDQFPGDV